MPDLDVRQLVGDGARGDDASRSIDAVTRDAFACHGPTPTKTHAPSSDHCGARNRTTRSSAGRDEGSSAFIAPFTTSVHTSSVCVGPFAPAALGRSQRRQRRRLLAPGETRVGVRRRIERAQHAGRGVVELQAVADAAIHGDGERERRALVLPRDLRHRSERRILAGRQVAHDERRARRDRFAGVGGFIARACRRIAPYRDVRPRRAERKRLHRIDHRRGAGREVDERRAAFESASCLSAAWLRLPRTCRPGTPPTSSRRRMPAARRRRRRWRAAGGRLEAQLVLAIRSVDAVDQPGAVRRQRRALRRQLLPSSVFVRLQDARLLCVEAEAGGHDQQGDAEANASDVHWAALR